MKKQLVAKLVIFTAAMVWLITYVYACIFFFDFWQDSLVYYAELEDGWFFTFMETFYLLTVFGIAVLLVRKAFNYILEAKWEATEEVEDVEAVEELKNDDNTGLAG